MIVALPLFRTGLSVAFDDPLVGADFLQGHRASRMEFLCADAYFGAEPELRTVGERGGRVGIDTCSVNLSCELICCLLVFSDDALAVSRTVLKDVLNGLISRGDRLDSHGVRLEFGAEGLLCGMSQQVSGVGGDTLLGLSLAQRLEGGLVSIDGDTAFHQWHAQCR